MPSQGFLACQTRCGVNRQPRQASSQTAIYGSNCAEVDHKLAGQAKTGHHRSRAGWLRAYLWKSQGPTVQACSASTPEMHEIICNGTIFISGIGMLTLQWNSNNTDPRCPAISASIACSSSSFFYSHAILLHGSLKQQK